MRVSIERSWDGQPVPETERVHIEARRTARKLRIEIDAPLHGDPAPRALPGCTDKLWEHEVVELFLLGDDAAYLEIELGPHGHHLALSLRGRRNVIEHGLPVTYSVTHGSSRWRGTAELDEIWLPPNPRRFNAYAIHGVGRERRHLAKFPVPGAEPDFHRLECFGDLPADDWR